MTGLLISHGPDMKPEPVSNAKILLIDDNRDGLLVRRSLLEELGYRVEITGTGEDALKMLTAARFDLVVTDYKMPRMNGTELIARIRKVDPDARVILLSGFVDPLALTEESTGADSVIAKSAREPAHLLRAVKRLLNRAPLRKQPGSQKGGGALSRMSSRGNLAH